MRRIGVFVCHCGTNIAATVDVKTVAETLGKEPAVVFATDYPYMCSEAGQNIIKDAIKEYQLEGVVVWFMVLLVCTRRHSVRQFQQPA